MQIEIDFDVFKELTARRKAEAVTYNDVVRELLGLNKAKGAAADLEAFEVWVSKGVSFPIGTAFRVRYKGEMHYGEVQKNGINVNGDLASSPSDAARIVTGNNVNGWRFWECKLPGHTKWQKIDSLRSH
ncbi:MAG: hypothetical protein AAFX39_01760 [Pseudomonadota bacterium]